MPEREPLDQIRASLQRGNFVDLLRGDTRHAGKKQLGLYFSNTASTGRSEIPVSSEQLASLLLKVDQISRWLFGNGQSGRNHPDYQIRIEDKLNTPEEMERIYFHKRGPFEATTYLFQKGDSRDSAKEDPKLRLSQDIQDKKAFICIDFLWNNKFELEVQFIEALGKDEPTPPDEIPEEMKGIIVEEYWKEAQREIREYEEKMREQGEDLERLQDYYYSGERPVNEMNSEEYAVITQCVDEFMLLEGIK